MVGFSKLLCLGFACIVVGYLIGDYNKSRKVNKNLNTSTDVKKYKSYYELVSCWMDKKLNNISLTEYFVNKGIESIAIYGMQEIGNYLYQELRNSEVTVRYAIDKNAGGVYSEIDVYTLQDCLPEVDLIVITPVHIVEDIINEIRGYTDIPVISLREIVFGVQY